MAEREARLAVYVHWPFCRAKCPYCDFNSHVPKGPVDASAFTDALVRELRHFAGLSAGRTVTSVFFGGGTPSLMPPEAVGRVLDTVAGLWPPAADVEVTLEANPTSAEARSFAGYRAAGVNRLSVGVQALNGRDLEALGREHSAQEALDAFRLAARLFPRTSFDLIYARPGQTVAAWRAELAAALAEQAGHMSLYQLTIEPRTAFAALHAAGRLRMPDDDRAAALYDETQEMTQRAGLCAYEVSNHAVPGQECRHNLAYWRYADYVGAGPGAHSRLSIGGTRHAISTERQPQTWHALVAERGHGIIETSALSATEQAEEMLLMGLRLSEGIDTGRHARLAGTPLDAERIAQLCEQGFLHRPRAGHLAATPAGRRVLDALIAELAAPALAA